MPTGQTKTPVIESILAENNSETKEDSEKSSNEKTSNIFNVEL